MKPNPRPVLAALLVAIVATWGICPCTFAKVLGLGDGPVAPCAQAAADAPDAPAACCCCKHDHEADPVDGAGDAPVDDECPCCSHGGCMRDLPPPAPLLALELPAPTFLDLPVALACSLCELPAPAVVAVDAGPPGAWRPHASPVGIVRLLS